MNGITRIPGAIPLFPDVTPQDRRLNLNRTSLSACGPYDDSKSRFPGIVTRISSPAKGKDGEGKVRKLLLGRVGARASQESRNKVLNILQYTYLLSPWCPGQGDTRAIRSSPVRLHTEKQAEKQFRREICVKRKGSELAGDQELP